MQNIKKENLGTKADGVKTFWDSNSGWCYLKKFIINLIRTKYEGLDRFFKKANQVTN